ncbi:hypothetical protein QYE76_013254 [Lolium multiflorum]|uniref:Gag-pol polyprotein n=1 Tax=Lolium multiflorum TaxID=4521 RepID=A0AAD8X724_LOLMU|nr:hypothetical protein QYE76_013254 [Lolium multiflorum]
MKNQQGFPETGRSQIRSDRPWHRTTRSPTGPSTGAIRARSSKEGRAPRSASGRQPGLDRLLRSMARSDRAPDRASRSATGLCACAIRALSSKEWRLPGQDPVPAPVGNRPARSVARCSVELWEIILHGYREPQDPVRLTSTEFYNRQLNASARDKIRSGINRKLLDQVNDIGSAKELWDRIVVLQEGTDLIQSALYETAKQEAHQFMIREGESVADAYARLGALRVRIKGLGVEKYDDGFEMNEGFIKSKVIAMIAVKQEDTNLALNLQIMTKSADLNSDDLVSYVAANENMAKAGKRLMAMNRVDEASHNHEASHNLALKARADHGGEEEYEIEEDEEMTSTSDIATDFAFFAKKYKGKLPMLLNDKKKKRTCYNCDEESHFANECPYEKRVDKPKFIKGVKPRLKPNPINDRYKRNKGRAFVGAEYLSDEEEEDEEKEAGVAGLAFSKPGSLFTYDYSKDYSTENDVGSSFMARTTQDDDSDDSTSSTIVGSCLMARETKDETHREFITFAKKAQRTYESEIKAIRTDNGTEFKNYTMQEFVDDEGIKHEFSAPYTPQQNGVVERKNRTIIEMARTMLSEFNSPHNFWGEAISTAVHYSNRLFLRPLHNKTPYELLTGNKPNVMYIRVFGCKCLVKNNKGKLGKFETRTIEGIFVGYAENSHAYRYYNRSTGTIEVSCDVVFLEDNGSQVEQVVPCVAGNDDDPSSAIKHMGIGHIRPMEVHSDDQGDGIEVSSSPQVEPSSTQVEPSSATQDVSSTQDEPHPEEQEESPQPTEQDHDDDQETSSTHVQAQVVPHDQVLARDEFIDHEGTIRKIKAATRASDMKVDQVLGSISKGVVHEALVDPDWVIAMQEELECFTRNEVWSLVERPKDHRINVIGTKWVFKNKQDENGIVIRNKARLVAQGFAQIEGSWSGEDRGTTAKRGRLAAAPPRRTSGRASQPTGGSSARGRTKTSANKRKDKHVAQDGDEVLPQFHVGNVHVGAWRRLRESNPYRFEEPTYTGGDKFFWTKTQQVMWDDYYNSQEHMKTGTIVMPKAIKDVIGMYEATKFRFVVETLRRMGLYDLMCLTPTDGCYCPILVRQFHCTVFFHDDAARTMTWMTGKQKYTCNYLDLCEALGFAGGRACGFKLYSQQTFTRGDIAFCYPPDPAPGPPSISGMYYSYLILAKLFRESLISKIGDTSECRAYHLNLMYYCHPEHQKLIDGCDLIYCELRRCVRERLTPNLAQYVQLLINKVVPAPLNTQGERVRMAAFKVPAQGDRPEVAAMMPSERRSKERHDHASSSYSRRPQHGVSRFFSSLWQMCKNTNDVAHQSLSLNQETRRRDTSPTYR